MALFFELDGAGSPYTTANLSFDSGGHFPHVISLNTSPSESGLLKYSCWAALVLIFERILSIRSSEFFSGHVDFPLLSRMFTISQWSAFSPALFTQQSGAMILPQNTTSMSSLTDLVGNSAPSNHSHFFFRVSGLRQSWSVSKSSTRIVSGRTASFLVPRGDSSAPIALNVAPFVRLNSSIVHFPYSRRSP